MEKQFYILIGRSGSGKGTQAELLMKHLSEKGAASVKHITTGEGFRNFVNSASHAASIARDINATGGLQPEFLAIWNWSNIFISTLSGDETVILDGAPRKSLEVSVLDGAIRFFGYKPPTVIYIDVSETWAKDKLRSRGRMDDKDEEALSRRMDWFMEEVLPCVEMYRNDVRTRFIHVNGEKTIDEVHREIIAAMEHK